MRCFRQTISGLPRSRFLAPLFWRAAAYNRLAVVATLAAIMPPAAANPTTGQPDKPLATHQSLPGAAELAEETEGIVSELTRLGEEIDRVMADAGPGRLPAKKLAGAIPKVLKARRNQAQLLILGEPVGVDLSLRLQPAADKLANACLAYGNSQPRVRSAMMQQLQKQQPKRSQQYEKVIGLAKNLQWAEAEKLLIPIGDQLSAEMWFIPLTDREPFYFPYAAANSAVESPMRQIRVADAQQRIEALIAEVSPDATALATWIETVAGQLSSGGVAAWDDAPAVAGPQVFDELVNRFIAGHTAFQRIAALRWIHRSQTGQTSYSGTAIPGEEQPLSDASRWTTTAVLGMAAVIKADASSVRAGDVPARHQAYLERVAMVLPRIAAQGADAELEQAMRTLLRVNSVYEESVKRYTAATRDVIVFRSRIATAQARRLEANFSPADAVVRDAMTAGPTSRGLYLKGIHAATAATLLDSAAKIMAVNGAQLVDQKVRVNRVVRISPDSRSSAGQLTNRTYATVASLPPIAREVERLKRDLLVDDAYRPLDTTSAIAVRSAELGDYVSVGGNVVSAQLESMIARFAKLPPAASSIIPAGEVVSLATESDPIAQMLVRVDVMPVWVQHPLFVAPAGGEK